MRVSYQTAGEIMQRDVTTVRPDATVRELVRVLSERGISGAPVRDAEGRVVGVVSATDVLSAAAREPERRMERTVGREGETEGRGAVDGFYEDTGAPPPRLGPLVLSLVPADWMDTRRVEDIMTRALHTVRPKTTLDHVARLFLGTGIHRALVMEGAELLGIVTTFDVLRCLVGRSETFAAAR